MKKTEQAGKKRALHTLLSDMLIAITPLFVAIVYNMLDVFFANPSDFDFVLGDFAVPMLVGVVGAGVVLGAVVWLFARQSRLHAFLLSLIVGSSIAVWIQITFLNSSLSILDGTALDWGVFTVNGLASVGMFVLCIALAVVLGQVFAHRWTSISTYICAILIAMVSAGIATSMLTATDQSFVRSKLYVDSSEQFTVAKKDNIIVVILDTVFNQVFEDVLEGNPDQAQHFADFTSYTNADSVYEPTFPSIVHMLTGMQLDPSLPIDENFDLLWSDQTRGAYDLIKNAGYKMHWYGESVNRLGGIERVQGIFDNVKASKGTPTVNKVELFKNLVAFAAYRALPYPLKQYTWARVNAMPAVSSSEDTASLNYFNYRFHESLKEQHLSYNDYDGLISVHYMYGIHSPFQTDANGNYTNEATQEETMLGCMKIMSAYLSELKAIDAYDTSAIIFLADHGDGEEGPQPFFLIKQPGEAHESMVLNAAPITYSEVFPTLLYMAGVNAPGELGQTVFDIPEDMQRERTTYIRQMDESYPLVPKHANHAVKARRNVYYAYTYTGDRDDLNESIANGDYQVVPMKDSFE